MTPLQKTIAALRRSKSARSIIEDALQANLKSITGCTACTDSIRWLRNPDYLIGRHSFSVYQEEKVLIKWLSWLGDALVINRTINPASGPELEGDFFAQDGQSRRWFPIEGPIVVPRAVWLPICTVAPWYYPLDVLLDGCLRFVERDVE